MLSAREVALEVTKALDEKKGIDIKVLRIEKISSIADYLLNNSITICNTAFHTIIAHLQRKCKCRILQLLPLYII